MATRYPAEFRHRAVELARQREKPILSIAQDLGIADATLHGWLKQADIDVASQIERLASLKEHGLLTDDEFAAHKAKLLG